MKIDGEIKEMEKTAPQTDWSIYKNLVHDQDCIQIQQGKKDVINCVLLSI